ncbi:unnamed protein product [Bursaphelenchus okinawaensis]|uniref:Uncharacterized protein n=1 Tax=Bursaphelenchus okinawaensis TaxID=465554 RepID=A0A811K3D4_9BILA|nr:unnamed protein product [Bursaphelenchus okinawaensis]CAG9091092.1 unnamed protein product [Bursaphelenchus okinawaensis]
MRRVPSDSEAASRCNGNSIHSILKESHRVSSISESSRNRHYSNDSCSSIKGVTFDKSLPTNAFRNEKSNDLASQSLRNRRTSLPVNTTLHPRLRDQGNVSEARGLVMDMLQNRDLQPQVISCLRAVASLLTPQMNGQNGNFMEFLPKVVENPYSGEQLTVSAVGSAH